MANAVAKIARPPHMRGFLHRAIKKNIIVASVLAVVTGVAMKVGYNDIRKQKYADFYKLNKDTKIFPHYLSSCRHTMTSYVVESDANIMSSVSQSNEKEKEDAKGEDTIDHSSHNTT